MKKIYNLALILFALLSSVLFSACGDKYGNLKMTIQINGKATDYVELVIDENSIEKSSATVGIEFSGVNENDIGQVLVSSVSEELIDTRGNYRFDGNKCFIEIDALNVGSGELVAYHYASGKSVSIGLEVKQKSSNIRLNQFDKYIVSIPYEKTNEHYLNKNQILTLFPYGSSDEVVYKLADGSYISENLTIVDNDGYIIGFNIPYTMDDMEIELYPVTKIKGYEDKEYKDKTFTVSFCKTVNTNNVYLEAKDSNYDITKTSHLIANDNKYSSMQVDVKYRDINVNSVEALYTIKTESTNKSINRVVDENTIFVEASSYTEEDETISVSLVPKNCVGDIQTITKSFKVKGDVKSTSIQVDKDGVKLSDEELNNIDLYDGYANGQGTLFKFKPTYGNNIPIFEGLRDIKISINGEILKSNNPGTGVFKYVLDIKKVDGTKLEFDYNTSTGKYETILDCENNGVEIYVGIVLGTSQTEATNLEFEVETINNSGLNYLAGIEETSVKLEFDSNEGVTSVSSSAVWYGEEESVGYHDLKSIIDNLYLNRNQGVDSVVEDPKPTSSDKAYKFILPNSVLGYNEQSLNSVKLEVEVKPEFENCKNPLKIAQTSAIVEYDAKTSIEYNYVQGNDDGSKIANLILLVFDENTDLGDYTIIFKQKGSGFESDANTGSIKVKVYQGFTADNINAVVEVDAIIDNRGNAFENYDADYIIASKQHANISVELSDSVLKSNIVQGYNFGTYTISNENVEDYFNTSVKEDIKENSANFNFVKGTYIANDKQYVTLTIKVKVTNYINFAEIGVGSSSYKYIEKDISFYIYDKVDYSNMFIELSDSIRYMDELLGIYNKDDAVANISIKMKDDNNSLWNYVTVKGGNLVTWSYENAETVVDSEINGGKGVRLTFKEQEDEYKVKVSAVVWQFGTSYAFTREILVKQPIISESVRIDSEVNYLPNGEMQIDLQQNEEYELKATNLSSKGVVDSQDIIVRIVDNNYTTLQTAVTLEGNLLKVNKIQGGLKLIVFAKDALELDVLATLAGYDDPSSFLMEGHKNAYLIINLQLSDGKSEETAYSIYNADDFKNIKNVMVVDEDGDGKLDNIYYRVMNNINLSSITKPITDFGGTFLTTFEYAKNADGTEKTDDEGNKIKIYNNFNLYGLKLGLNITNLFTQFSGNMSNLTYTVDYDYQINNNNINYLGVIGCNAGTLTNVCVKVSGDAELKGNNVAYFGSLVGENKGIIKYEDSFLGVFGEITLTGDKQTYFGGLVGLNYGEIIGYSQSTESAESGVSFVVSIEQEGYTSNLTITATGLTKDNSAIGGVVGLNTANDDKSLIGTIKNAKVSGSITGKNNIGGVIGENNLKDTHSATLILNASGELDDVVNNFFIENIVSSVVINGENNVGGIVGLDNEGTYKDCKYQIKPSISAYATKTAALVGLNNVGGIAGQSKHGKFKFCSVMSYWWDYNNLTTTFNEKTADIVGADYVGGIVGNAINSNSTLNNNASVTQNVAITYSSVNAYIVGAEDKNLGGLLSVESGKSIVGNAYFIGKLDGKIYSDSNNLCIVNKGESLLFNIVYNVRNYLTFKVEGSYKDGSSFDLQGGLSLGNWKYDSSLNGGYIYIVNEDNKPIFEVAPTSVHATINTEYAISGKVLYLEYFDFNNSVNDKQILELLNIDKNNHALKDLLTFTYEPTTLSNVQLKVISSDVTKLRVNVDGTITVCGVGYCTLEFVSALNPGVSTGKIDVYISYPLGTMKITDGNEFDSSEDSEDNIANGQSKRYFIETNGLFERGDEGNKVSYSYITNTSPSLKIDVAISVGPIVNIDDYLLVNGKRGDGNYTLSSVSQFSLSILEYKEGLKFSITITPCLEFEINGVEYSKDYDNSQSFNLGMKNGATDISLNYNYAVLYPNDETVLKITVDTDTKIDNIINILSSFVVDKENKTTSVNKYFEIEYGELLENKQLITMTLRVDKTVNSMHVWDLSFALNNGKTAFVRYTILPQRIDDIDIKNYTLKDDDNDGEKEIDELKFVLKPTTPNSSNGGMMEINMVPDNAYYDYLEIRDITGDEEIRFVQVKDYKGETVISNPQMTADSKGIKLIKDYSGFAGTIYVYTQIDADYSSKPHTVEISAYLNNGQFLYAQTYTIEVRMLPSVTINHMLPNGRVGASVTDQDNNNDNYIALNVDTEIRVDTKNVTEPVEVTLDTTGLTGSYSVVNTYGNFWTITGAGSSDDLGQILTLKVKALSVADNGDTDETTASIKFKIVNYVVHGVSVNNSHNNIDNPDIYGNFDNPIELEFYFNSTDISYEGNRNHDKVHRIGDIYDDTNNLLKSIYGILTTLNNNPDDYLFLNTGIDSNGEFVVYLGSKVSRDDNKLVVYKDYDENGPVYLAVDFNLDLISNLWEIPETTTTNCEDNVQINYQLNFTSASSMVEPQLVRNADEFKDMADGENYYILGQDIELENYIPLDKNIKEFDGNGHTITIKSFDYSGFEDVDLKAGLFKQIYKGMIVKNLKVKYVSTMQDGTGYSFGVVNRGIKTFADLCANKEISYNSAQFGGLTAVNNGIITNCQVEGQVVLRASTVEEKVAENVGVFKIGGLVATNAETGYITHSTTMLNIISQANIGGFIYENEGKIASSGVYDILVDSYNSNLGNRVVVDVAGFVVKNSGSITMSYVELLTNTISAHDSGAGFVYNNSGSITDCYMEMTSTGDNSNEFSGFVHQNSGTVSTSYSYFNKGVLGENNYYFFTPNATEGIINCFEIVDLSSNVGYEKSGVENLFTIDFDDKNLRSSYEWKGFAFGDNETAVWKYVAGKTPRLISTLEKVEHVKNTGTATYYGLQNIVETKIYENGVETIKVEVNHSTYGTKNNPYIIHDLATWDYYFSDGTTKYYRIVADIDFKTTTPITSKFTFSGNIQGNKMNVSNYMLNSNESLEAIGLFKKLVYVNDVNVQNAVRNLNLDTYSIWASKTQAVGMLAGSLENFNVYNIGLKSNNMIVGGNAVGGLVGIAYGQFDIQKIDSSVSVNSSRITQNSYSIYMSAVNNRVDSNLSNVYYAGGVVGILDGYLNSSFNKLKRYNYIVDDRVANYCNVRTINVSGEIDVIGDYVGGAFGFVGERVYVKDVYINLEEANLAGALYAAGVVAENRGVVDNAIVTLTTDSFNGTDLYDTEISAGVVGLNIGGRINNVNAKADIIKTNKDSIVGGIVGRNINGVITNAFFDGKLFADFVGGIIGTDYVENDTYKKFYTASLSLECSNNESLIPNNIVEYYDINSGSYPIENYANLLISKNTLTYMLENSNKFYAFKKANNLNASIIGKKVFGLVVGLTNKTNIVGNYGFDKDKMMLIFNKEAQIVPEVGTFDVKVENGKLISAVATDEDTFNIGYVNIIKESGIIPEELKNNVCVTYVIGSNVTVMDIWSTSVYGNDILVFGEGLNFEQHIKLLNATVEQEFLIALTSSTRNETITKEGEIIKSIDVEQTYEYALRANTVTEISLDLTKMFEENEFIIEGKIDSNKIVEPGPDDTDKFKYILDTEPVTSLLLYEKEISNSVVTVIVQYTEKIEGVFYYYSTTYSFNII